MHLHDVRRSSALAASAAAAALLLAACGSSGNGDTYGAGSAATTATSSDQGSDSSDSSDRSGTSGSSNSGDSGDEGAESIGTASGDAGTYLTGDDGRAVYLWVADTGTASTCSGACASAWPPVLTTGKPTAEDGAKAADLGTTKRSDGGTQVTYRGHPLYYYAGDTADGQTSGQGSDGFGAKWWLVAPDGSAITSSSGGGRGGY